MAKIKQFEQVQDAGFGLKWVDGRAKLLRRLDGGPWTPQDYSNLHHLTANQDILQMLLRLDSVPLALARSLWRTPTWFHSPAMIKLLSQEEVAELLAPRAVGEMLVTLSKDAQAYASAAIPAACDSAADLACMLSDLESGSLARKLPRSPIQHTASLRPLTSLAALRREEKVTGVEFPVCWLESIADDIASVFAWLGKPRATVMVIRSGRELTFIECRKHADKVLTPDEAAPIMKELFEAFRVAGYELCRKETTH